MSVELTQCPACKLFVSMRGYDHHIMRCTGECYCDSASRRFFGCNSEEHVPPCPQAAHTTGQGGQS